MADNAEVADVTIAMDEVSIGGVNAKVQRVKQGYGGDGVFTEIQQTAPLPVGAYLQSTSMQNGATQLTVKRAYVNLTASGDIVAAVTGKKIRVLAMHVDEEDQTADVELIVEDASGGSDLAAATGFDLHPTNFAFCPVGWFETTAGNALYGTVAGETPDLNICVVYVEV